MDENRWGEDHGLDEESAKDELDRRLGWEHRKDERSEWDEGDECV